MSAQLEPLRRHLATRPQLVRRAEDRGPVVFASGKGGSGTSTLAALLAVAAAEAGQRVLLIDGTAGIASLHLYLGVPAGAGWAALTGGGAPADLVVEVAERLHLLPGAAGDAADPMVSAAERQTLFRRISTLYPAYDLVLIDAGSRVESVLNACGPGASRLVAVSTPDRVSLAATYALVKVVAGRLPELPVTVLANRGDEDAAEGIRGAALRFLDRTLEAAGAIPDYECLRAGINAGMNIQDAAMDSPAAQAMMEAATRFVRGFRAGLVPETRYNTHGGRDR